MKQQPIKVILKTEKFNGSTRPVLFLPDTSCNTGFIAYFSPDEGHGEACYEYYLSCKPMKDKILADKLLAMYSGYGEVYPVKRVYRRSLNDIKQANNHRKQLSCT